ADLSAVGGPTNGTVLDSILQEVDVRTGKVLLEWQSLDHVPITETYSPVLDPFDYFHLNSIDVDPLDGNLIISARNTSAIYKLDRKTGEVLWRLNGRSSDFQLGLDAPFMYQHDARMHTDGTLTLFDDGPSSSSADSRALRLGLDFGAMRADVLQQYHHPTPLAASAMGNAQILPGDAMLVGWGTEPYFTEFGPAGDVRLDAKFDGNAWNYRAFRDVWVGHPTTKPAVAALKQNGKVTVYASWNGSTETAYWRVAAGLTRTGLQTVKTVTAVPFETVVPVAVRPAFISVTALDGSRKPLATSPVVTVRG
ncbi:MAG TPA: arylsulfotransferase family protein, partial [Gaiellaceae bacterium]